MSFALACSHLQTKIGSPCMHLMTLPEKTEYGPEYVEQVWHKLS